MYLSFNGGLHIFSSFQSARENFWHSSEGVEGQSAKGKNVDGAVNHWEPPQWF